MRPLDRSMAAGAPARLEPATTGFDFDGVIADTVEAFLRLACEDYGHCGISAEDITSFCVEECLPVERQTLAAIFEHITFAPLACGLKPMAGAVQVLYSGGVRHIAKPRDILYLQYALVFIG